MIDSDSLNLKIKLKLLVKKTTSQSIIFSFDRITSRNAHVGARETRMCTVYRMCTRHLHSLTEAHWQSSLIRLGSMFISALYEAPLVISLSLFILRKRIQRLITCQCCCIHSSGLTRRSSNHDQHVVCLIHVQSLSSINQSS